MTMVVMMGIVPLVHMMMFDDDDDGCGKEMTKLAAGLTGTMVHPEMMQVTVDMTVLEFAEMTVAILAIGLTIVVVLHAVIMVASLRQQ